MPMDFSSNETKRYLRQMTLPEFSERGQTAVTKSRVLIVGAGGLGSPVIAYLAGLGVGTLGIVDGDRLALSNLHRQVIHRTEDVGLSKAQSSARFAGTLNPLVQAVPHPFSVTGENVAELVSQYDLVVDGTDNIAARRHVAGACFALGKPLVTGAVLGLDGFVTTFRAESTAWPAAFDVLFPNNFDPRLAPTCEITGVLGPITGVLGALMAMEAVKLLTGIGAALIGRMLFYDGRNATFKEVQI